MQGAQRRAIIIARVAAAAVMVAITVAMVRSAEFLAGWIHDTVNVDVDVARGFLALSLIGMITLVAMWILSREEARAHERQGDDRLIWVTKDADGEPRVLFRDEATRKRAVDACAELVKEQERGDRLRIRPLRYVVTAPTVGADGKILNGYARRSETLYMPDTPPKGNA
jgi:hypothetical protein